MEKSKRVKAFRCGEFDDCIERAESSQGMPIKKREKYARREDAILHALELERQLLKKQGKLGIVTDQTNRRSSNAAKKGIITYPKTLGNDNEKHSNLSLLASCSGGPFPSDSANDGNPTSSEEDLSEATPHMEGLLDFGHKIPLGKGTDNLLLVQMFLKNLQSMIVLRVYQEVAFAWEVEFMLLVKFFGLKKNWSDEG